MGLNERYKIYFIIACVLYGCETSVAGQNSWTSQGPDLLVNTLLFQPQHLGDLYAGTVDGLYRSEDSGTNWHLVEGPLAGNNVLSMAATSERLYVGLNRGLYYSEDDGINWLLAKGPGNGILALAVASQQVYAGTFGRGVFTSADGGATWSTATGALSGAIVFSLRIAPQDNQTVYAGTASGLFVSQDAGVNWTVLGEALVGQSIRTIYVSDEDPGTIIIGTFGNGIWRSLDGGQTWLASNNGLDDLAIRALAVDPRSAALIYAATFTGGFFRSKDGGEQWTSINAGLPSANTRTIVVDPNQTERLLGGGPGLGIWTIDFAPEALLGLDRSLVDFGSVRVGQVAEQPLRISNLGGAPLEISELTLGRGSAFSIVDATQIIVAAGESRTVNVRYQPQIRLAARDTLRIYSNDAETPVIDMLLQGLGVEAEVRIVPERVDFGAIRMGVFSDTIIVVANAGNAPLNIENVFFEHTAFRVLSFDAGILPPGGISQIKIRFLPYQTGGLRGTLVILSDVPKQRRIERTFDGVGTAPELSGLPTDVDFGNVDLGRTRSIELAISNSGNTLLTIEQLELSGGSFRVNEILPLSLEPGEGGVLTVSFLPLQSGTKIDTLVLISDMPGLASRHVMTLRGSGGALALRPETPAAAGNGAAAMVLVDFNQDGFQDMALADSSAGQIQVWLNDGNGTFPVAGRTVYPSAVSTFQRWDQPIALSAAAVFGAAPDLIIADQIGRSISILANDGKGGFNDNRTDVFIGHALRAVEALDLDADGDTDIAVADGSAPSLTILFNNGQGSFNARISRAVDEGPSAIRGANLNADNHNDLVVANQLVGTVSVLLNDRSGGFVQRRDYAVGSEPVELVLVDYDADGDNDILSANQGSRDITLLENDGHGFFTLRQRLPTGMVPLGLSMSDLTADAFSDLTVAGASRPFVGFWENDGGNGFTSKDILSITAPVRQVEIVDMDGDGDNDLIALSNQIQIFLNEDTRRLDPPRPPTQVQAQDRPRDLGRSIEIQWQAPELDEQIGRTTEYRIFRAEQFNGTFTAIGAEPAGQRRFIDVEATLADTFYYFIRAGNASSASTPSDTVFAVSRPAPFFELELVDEPRLSVGDTLRLKAFITPADHAIAGLSLYLTFADSAMTLIPADSNEVGFVPFRLEPSLAHIVLLENRLQYGSTNKINVSLAGLPFVPGIEPVALGEVWFRTSKDTATVITIDDEPEANRRSAVVEAQTGEWIQPFIPEQPMQVIIKDFKVSGLVEFQARHAPFEDIQVTLSLLDLLGTQLISPLNDEDRLQPGIQYTLDSFGRFALAQIPRGKYQIFAKGPSHLQGQVIGDTISVGDSLGIDLRFAWAGSDSSSTTALPTGDADGDNRINLADFGLLIRYSNVDQLQSMLWPEAKRADFNGDGSVNLDDLFLIAQNFGRVGMRVRHLSAKAGGAWASWDSTSRELCLHNTEKIRGFAVRLRGVSEVQAGALWAHHPFEKFQWQDKGDTRIMAALADPNAWAGAGRLLVVEDVGVIPIEVEILDRGGDVQVLPIRHHKIEPLRAVLKANYPNPFNPETTILYTVGGHREDANVAVSLAIYDVLGQTVRQLVDARLQPGEYQAVWNGTNDSGQHLASGIYFYRLETGAFSQTRRLMLLR